MNNVSLDNAKSFTFSTYPEKYVEEFKKRSNNSIKINSLQEIFAKLNRDARLGEPHSARIWLNSGEGSIEKIANSHAAFIFEKEGRVKTISVEEAFLWGQADIEVAITFPMKTNVKQLFKVKIQPHKNKEAEQLCRDFTFTLFSSIFSDGQDEPPASRQSEKENRDEKVHLLYHSLKTFFYDRVETS